MVDAIISAVVEDLTSMLLSSIKEEVKLVTGVNNEVKKLLSNFKSIQALLDDAEKRQLNEVSVKNWLFNLKAVSYDMDDVLDEWKTWIRTSPLQHQHHSSGSNQNHLKHKVLSIFCCNCFPVSDVGLHHVVGGRIKEICQILDDIATDKVRYQLNSTNISDKHIERHVTTSFVDTQKVKGRDVEKDEVKSMILKPKSRVHVISLVGMGGIGKTTVARLVYNDSEIETHFDKRIWVCVSESFDEIRIAKEILKSIDSSIFHDLMELEKLLQMIQAILCEKKFLLVLDDVWNESCAKWEDLEQFLMCGLFGSTILITTRKLEVALVMGCRYESIYRVGLLSSEQCWSIISQIALVQGDSQKLESIGRRIADKCKGLPLVATTVGGLLCLKKSEKEWLRVLEKKEWEGNDELDPLKLSYYDLPLSLKQCFKYCAIFKDSKISKRKLIGMWMAQGYLIRKERDEDLEMIGEIYFDNLIANSLLQISSYNEDCYVLHDMVSDLAQIFTKNECLMIEVLKDTEFNGNSLHADANVRHLTLKIENDVSFPMSIYDLNKLRSLIIQFVSYESSLNVVVLEDIFDHLTCLRTLDLSSCGIQEVPFSINRLIHLRWLDLSMNGNLKRLPETLCECYNLQTLILCWCKNLVELPQGIGKLINLMYLDIESCNGIKYLPKGIGNLWRLKQLNEFIIGMYENGTSCIVEMEKLNNLRGSLRIRGLGNVRRLEEARKAQLIKKKNLTNLTLSFDRDHVLEDEEQLLEALEPPSDLEILYIDGYNGKTLTLSWMMKLNELRVLTISKCRNCEELPPLGKLPCLEELYLKNMEVKRVGVEFMGIEKEKDASSFLQSFPKLKKLGFEEFTEWEEWDDIDEWLMERINNKTIIIMLCLQKLSISRCRKLKTLPYHLLSPPVTTRLQKLYIDDCDVLQLEVQNDKLSHISRLRIQSESLTIRVGHGRKPEEVRNQLMKEKNINDLSLIFDGDNGMKNEEELLEALEPPSNLEKLSIRDYKGKTFPNWMMTLNLLRRLTIDRCETCEELPPVGKLLCLEELYLKNMRVKRVGVEFIGIEKEKDASTSFLSFPKLRILYFLEFMEWEEWDEIDEWLMDRINNKIITVMPYLQKLSIFRCRKLKALPHHLLSPLITTRLQELNISDCDVLQAEVHKEKLSHIPYLTIAPGCLTIRGLGHVRKREEARKAQLMKKKNVIYLWLIFDGEEIVEGDNGMKDEEKLLEALEPPSDLEKLSIEDYKGKTLFPSWMMKLNLLRKLTIHNSKNCEELPPLGKLSCLEELEIYDMRVKRVGVEFMGIEKEKDASTSFLSFPKLKILDFTALEEWEEWDDIDEWLMERINNKTVTIMPCLQELTVRWCLRLKKLPYHLLSPLITTRLQELDISFCDVLQHKVQKDKLSRIPHLMIQPESLMIRLGHGRKLKEARNQLTKEKNVCDLSLIFDGDNGMKDEEELLEALEPPLDLEILSIRDYKGKTLSPNWMMKLNLLRKLMIDNSGNCEELPPLGKLSCLEELCLENMGVKRVGVEFMGIEKEKDASTSFLSFPKLKKLYFSNFLKWKEWDDIDECLMETITVMPCLQELTLYLCPKLKILPYYLLSSPITTGLQKLNIRLCDVIEANVQKDKLFHIPHFPINCAGSLTIRGLGHVRKQTEGRKAQLTKKKNVIDLRLIFDVEEYEEETVERDNMMKEEEELLKALEPPSDLEELSIEVYKGKTLFPSWLMKLNLLRKLTIYRCENCKELPPLGKLSCLEKLYLYDMEVKRVGVEFTGIKENKDPSTSFVSFPKLKILQFQYCWEWEEWDDIDESLMETITVMPCLKKLTLDFCPKLKTLFPKWMIKLNVLRVLTISKCRNCKELPPLGKLPCLEELYLKNMEVKRVGVEFMGIEKEKDASTSFLSFPKLKILQFQCCWEWEEWDDIDKWLIEGIDIDELLVDRINMKTIIVMPCLQKLSIYRCQKLKTLPYYLLSPRITTRLQQLYIARCDVLHQEVQKDKLSYIPHLRILPEEEEEEEED